MQAGGLLTQVKIHMPSKGNFLIHAILSSPK